MTPRILFVSRAYPPIIGGIENQNAGIATALQELTQSKTIANTRGKSFLPVFLPYALVLMLCNMHKYDVLLVGDGVLAPLARAVKFIYPRKKYASIVHGLDVTYAKKKGLIAKIYKKINVPALNGLDKLIMVGRFTIEQAVQSGIDREKCTFIPNGYNPDDFKVSPNRDVLEKFLGKDLGGKKVLLRIGRFVEHKGVPWFVENVIPHLDDDIVFVAAGGRVTSSFGDRDAFKQTQEIVRRKGLEEKVLLYTDLPWSDITMLYANADLYISPNVHVEGSAEGFGINAIEAAASGTTVLASNFQGLQDAIEDEKNGFLVPHEDVRSWTRAIETKLRKDFDRETFGVAASKYTREHFSWDAIGKRYLKELSQALS